MDFNTGVLGSNLRYNFYVNVNRILQKRRFASYVRNVYVDTRYILGARSLILN